MPGMTNGLNINDPIVVAAFRTALLHQGVAALLIFAVLSIAWVAIRERRTAAAGESPHWVQALVNWAGTSWSYHPVQAGAAAVWVQVGIGLWLLVAPRGIMSRLAGVAGVVWGLIVWVFGEAFGVIFAPGLNWL